MSDFYQGNKFVYSSIFVMHSFNENAVESACTYSI
jgi:hypothetical protein